MLPSTTASTSSTSSTSHPGPAASTASAADRPGLHVRTSLAEQIFRDVIDQPGDDGDDLAGAHERHTLESLEELLCNTSVDDLPSVLTCFEQLAYYRETVASAAQRSPPAAAMSALGARLQIFLEQFDRRVRGGVIDLKIAGPTVAATLCSGLGVLPAILEAGLLGKAARKELVSTAAQLTRVLTVAVTGAPDASDTQRTDDMLAMLTWLSRGLKAGLLVSDDRAVRDAFSAALDRMPEWAAEPGPSGLDGYKLASCFVQVNTIRQFALLHLDSDGASAQANRRRLQGVLRSLCAALPDIFAHAAGVNGVQTTNVGNTIKDFVDADLLPKQTHVWLMPVIRVLLQRMPRVPQSEMLRRGGQTLANCSNFLRMLSESELRMESGFSGCRDAWQAGCAHLTGMLAHDHFVLRGKIGQSLSNLMSFVRAMALQDERQQPVGQAQLKVAAHSLTRLLKTENLQRLSPMSISGMLSALCTFWGRGLAPAATCRALTQGLIAAIPSCAGRQCDSATVALSLRALVQLHELDRSAPAKVQAAFQHLLQLLAKKPMQDDAQRLYCLKALQLGLQQKWTTVEQAELQAALRRLLRWEGKDSPGIAQLEAAIASLRHGEEAPPAQLAVFEETARPVLLQAGTAAGTPVGGKPAAGGAPTYRQEREKGKASTTYRAPAAATTAAVSMTTSTTPAARTSRTQQQAASGRAGRNAAPTQASPVTQWFTLASSAERGAGLIEQMTRLASGRNVAMVNHTDEFGNSALYYAVLAGKPELVQWLLRHPAFTLDMSEEQAEELMTRLEHNILSSINWGEAKQALALLGAEVRRAWPVKDIEKDEPQPASSYSERKGQQARSVQKLGAELKTDPKKRKAEWFGLARGNDGGKQVLRQMRRLDEIDPELFHSFDEFGEDALHYAEVLGKQKIKAWLSELGMRRAMNAGFELRRQYVEAGGLYGFMEKSRRHSSSVDETMSTAEIVASVREDLAKYDAENPYRPPTDDEKIALACAQGDVASVRRLLRTEGGKAWARTAVDDHGHNQLMTAAYQGNVNMVEALLDVDQGALAEQPSTRGYTALLIAALAGQLDVVKILLKFDHGRFAVLVTPAGYNVLIVAAERGMNHCVKYLLAWNSGLLTQYLSDQMENALTIAARNGHVDVVRTLLAYEDGRLAEVLERNNSNPMCAAAECGHAHVVKLLLAWRDGSMAMAGHGEFTPLLLAAQEGHVDVLKVLLESKDGPLLAKCCLQDGSNALALAERHGHVEAARFLRAFDGGSLIGNADAARASSQVGDMSELQALAVEQFAKRIDSNGEDALMAAARFGAADVVEMLFMRQGHACITRRNLAGDNALIIAARGKHADVVRKIFEHVPAPVLYQEMQKDGFRVVQFIREMQDHTLLDFLFRFMAKAKQTD